MGYKQFTVEKSSLKTTGERQLLGELVFLRKWNKEENNTFKYFKTAKNIIKIKGTVLNLKDKDFGKAKVLLALCGIN